MVFEIDLFGVEILGRLYHCVGPDQLVFARRRTVAVAHTVRVGEPLSFDDPGLVFIQFLGLVCLLFGFLGLLLALVFLEFSVIASLITVFFISIIEKATFWGLTFGLPGFA